MTCSTTLNSHDIGDIVRLRVAIVNADGDAIDPPEVQCKVTDPNETSATYVYGTDDEVLIRDSTGNYSCYVALDIAGKWKYKWFGLDPDTPLYQRVAGAEESAFLVDLSEIDGLGVSGSYGGGLDGGSP